jgi:hypothetical protein
LAIFQTNLRNLTTLLDTPKKIHETSSMPSKYEQFEALASSYEKHPDQGLKACKKKLQRDPSNVICLVRDPTSKARVHPQP